MDGEISAEGLWERIRGDDAVRIVDIRSPERFGRGHIPGSENVPFAELTGRVERFAGEEHVVTVCPHGKASRQAARLIGSFEGFDGRVESLASGIEGWSYELKADEGGSEGPDAPF
ncbi:rhodanese-like domain-containing protein [Natronomonas sp.]|uniref:rhodanese-like domain-containing protein n=1 Tax=Natronomonas sp. TaxID=2184060 RepID=UPI002605422F|nr:rhodanese-like domain-containing protein [Natronomonas sp.]